MRRRTGSTMDDKAEIDELARRFYSLFTKRNGASPNVAAIHDLFIVNGIIISTSKETPTLYDLSGFVEPRERLLRSGELVEFEEREVLERTSVAGYVAQRLSVYEKSGVLNGEPYHGRGIKMMQFVQENGSWKFSSVAWDDERDGFTLNLEDFSSR